ncbi:MAG: pyruvate kinase [Coriobacteriia bacterium]|nr:pyruvate kinase [Coriobacteriia bacterium]
MRRTKIVATIGPATDSADVLDALVAAGINVARLNSSHAAIPELTRRLESVRAAAERGGRHVAVMLDLAGPKVRVGDMVAGTVLVPGDAFMLAAEKCVGDATRACVTYAGLAGDVTPGDRVLVDDGRIELVVESVAGGNLHTRVVYGGPLSSHKGVNVPGVTLSVDSVTAYDREVLSWGLAAGVDLIAQSFVRGPGDVEELRRLTHEYGIPIVAKIEKHEAAHRVEEIIAVADAVMVARGDLGVETSAEAVPVLQRRIVRACRDSGTPVIVATQMLESMITESGPTRAEASDIANAIFGRVDAVMLSAETAIGSHPVRVVDTMARIAVMAEESLDPLSRRRTDTGTRDLTEAVSSAVCELADDLGLAAIVTATQSGATARAVAGKRPATPIIAVTPHPHIARRLALVWGVTPLVVPLAEETDSMLAAVDNALMGAGLAEEGDRIAVTAGIATRVQGATDFIVVREIHAV